MASSIFVVACRIFQLLHTESWVIACKLELCHVGSRSLTKHWTWVPCSDSMESATGPPGKWVPDPVIFLVKWFSNLSPSISSTICWCLTKSYVSNKSEESYIVINLGQPPRGKSQFWLRENERTNCKTWLRLISSWITQSFVSDPGVSCLLPFTYKTVTG